MRKPPLFPLVLTLLSPSLALAQPVPQTQPPPGGGPATPTMRPGDQPAGAAEAPVAIPPPPSVNDPMLAPVPPAARSISTWEQALALLRSRSTDLRTSYDQVLQAEANTRTALAATLPTITGTATATHNFLTNTSAQVVGVNSTTLQPVFESFTAPTPNYISGNIQVVQPLIAAEAWHAVGIAKVGEDSARLSLEDMKRV